MEKQKVVMYGPSFGHNIVPFLEFFNSSSKYQLVFIYRGELKFNTKFENVSFFKFTWHPINIMRLRKLFSSGISIIWVHGGNNPYILLAFKILKKRNTTITLNIWGEALLHSLMIKNIRSFLYMFILKRFDYLQCNWYGTYNILKELKFENGIVLLWGLDRQTFEKRQGIKRNLHPFIENFISGLPTGKLFFFYPKSFTKGSRHDLLIQALWKLKKEGLTNYHVIFWPGNIQDDEVYDKIRVMIQDMDLEREISIVKHPFIEFSDYMAIWDYMDCGLQIAEHDQLSSTFTEPLALRKDLIASKIEPYIIFEKEFDISLNLVELDIDILAERLRNFIKNRSVDNFELDRRAKIMKERYCFQDNIEKALQFYTNRDNLN